MTVGQVMEAVETLEQCSVADSFCSLELAALGIVVLFHASWVHREPERDRPPAMPPGWRPVATATELAEWTGVSTASGSGRALLDRSAGDEHVLAAVVGQRLVVEPAPE